MALSTQLVHGNHGGSTLTPEIQDSTVSSSFCMQKCLHLFTATIQQHLEAVLAWLPVLPPGMAGIAVPIAVRKIHALTSCSVNFSFPDSIC